MSIILTGPTEPVKVGTPITYKLAVRNNGNGPAQDVVVRHTMPAGLTVQSVPPGCSQAGSPVVITCNLGNFPVDKDAELVIIATASKPGTFANIATVETQGDPYLGDNTDSTITYVYQPTCGAFEANGEPYDCPAGFVINLARLSSTTPSDSVCCTANVLRANAPTLSLTMSGPTTPVSIGETFDYTIVVGNAGLTDINDVVVSDPLPDSVDCKAVAPTPACGLASNTVTCNYAKLPVGAERTITITCTAKAPGAVPNVATATGTGVTGEKVNGQVDAILSLVFTPRCGAATWNSGNFECPAGYFFNSGAAQATAPNGGALTVDLCCTKSAAAPVDLYVKKTASVSKSKVGDKIKFTLITGVRGNAGASNVVVTDELPAGLKFVSVTPSSFCSNKGQTVSCTYPTMPGKSTRRATIVASAVKEGDYVNVATVTSPSVPTPLTANSRSQVPFTVVVRTGVGG
jgi:uncharacterized repeat protein (TIGR01451 family)